MAYSPTKTDATAVATDTIARLNTSPSPNVGAVLGDPLVALQDSMLCSVGYQAQNDQAGSTASTSSGTFSNVFNSWAPTVPVAKTYLLHVDVIVFASNVGTQNRGVNFNVTVDGTSVSSQPTNIMSFAFNVVNKHERISFRLPVAFSSAGSHTIRLQWSAANGATVNTNSDDALCMTLTG